MDEAAAVYDLAFSKPMCDIACEAVGTQSEVRMTDLKTIKFENILFVHKLERGTGSRLLAYYGLKTAEDSVAG